MPCTTRFAVLCEEIASFRRAFAHPMHKSNTLTILQGVELSLSSLFHLSILHPSPDAL